MHGFGDLRKCRQIHIDGKRADRGEGSQDDNDQISVSRLRHILQIISAGAFSKILQPFGKTKHCYLTYRNLVAAHQGFELRDTDWKSRYSRFGNPRYKFKPLR